MYSMKQKKFGSCLAVAAAPPTDCQQEAWGLKPVRIPDFRPRCDPTSGLYWPQQCIAETCWCVNPATGEEIPGSMYTYDPAKCGAGPARAVASGEEVSQSLYQHWFIYLFKSNLVCTFYADCKCRLINIFIVCLFKLLMYIHICIFIS